MIISISGEIGSGKSTVAKEVAKRLNYKHHSTGEFMRQMAEERNMSLLELSKIAEKDKSIDEELDKRQIDLGKKEDNFVIDARLGFHFIPHSIKIFLNAELETRAERILKDEIRNEHNPDIHKTIENIKRREESEKQRYEEYYNLNPHDTKNYDFVLDTTNLTIEEAVDKVLEFVQICGSKKSMG